MRRYLRLLALSFRASLLVGMQYRWDFLLQGLLQLGWAALSVLPLLIAYHARGAAGDLPMTQASIGDWGFYPAMLVFGFFLLLKAVLDWSINPSLSAVVEHIRTGTLDFVLLKPADAQFLVSTTRFEPWHVIDAAAALGLLAFAAAKAGPLPGPLPVLAAALLFGCALVLLYSIWVLVICAAFYVVKVDNLSFLFTSVFDFARWPRSVFRGALHVVFTYVVPLVLMTSYPADALLRKLTPAQGLLPLLFAALLFTVSRLIFRGSIRRYTSASS